MRNKLLHLILYVSATLGSSLAQSTGEHYYHSTKGTSFLYLNFDTDSFYARQYLFNSLTYSKGIFTKADDTIILNSHYDQDIIILNVEERFEEKNLHSERIVVRKGIDIH